MSQFFPSFRLSRIGSETESEDDDIRRATLSPGMGIRVSAVDTLGHLSLVITRDLFLSNADALFTVLVGLLAKQGVRDDRLGALFILRNLINSSRQSQPAAIVGGVQHLIADVDLAVGVLLSELFLILGEAGFLTPTAHGEPPADGNHEEKVFLHCSKALCSCLLTTAPTLYQRHRSELAVCGKLSEPCLHSVCHLESSTSRREAGPYRTS